MTDDNVNPTGAAEPERLGEGISDFRATMANTNAFVAEARQALSDFISGRLVLAATVNGITVHVQVQRVVAPPK